MKRIIAVFACLGILVGGLVVALAAGPQIISSFAPESNTEAFVKITAAYTGDWQQYGEVFTLWQSERFSTMFLLVLTLVPLVFLLHYLAIGAMEFSHAGPEILFFGLFCRLIHWLAAISFTLLTGTGLMIIFGYFLGGGALVQAARTVHLFAALLGTAAAIPMFLIWVRDMLPAPHDLAWMLIMGGYLSKAKKPVPAGKFNAGQKTWFWLATVGTGVMAYSGYLLYTFQGATDQLRIMVMIHNILGAVMIAFFIIHLYMATLAIKGALTSMITGYKPREEVEILHSRYDFKK